MWDGFIAPPRWFTGIIFGTIAASIIVLLLVIAFNPHQTNSTLNLMLLGLPAYSSISGLLAYLVYGERPEVAWVLLYLVWAAFGFCFLMIIL